MMHGGQIIVVCVHQIGSIGCGLIKKDVQVNKSIIQLQFFSFLVGIDIMRGKK